MDNTSSNYICTQEPSLCISNNPDTSLGSFTDDGTCDIVGCTDPIATNYDPTATIDSGECLYEGCDDMSAYNYAPLDPAGTVWDAYNYNLCEFAGCAFATHPSDPNLASINNGASNGCPPATSTVIPNGIDPTGELDANDMSCCDFPGCTDSTMANYNQYATSDDGSCLAFCKRVKAVQCKPDTEGDDYERTIGCMWINNQQPYVGDEFIAQGYIYNTNQNTNMIYVQPWTQGQYHHFPNNPPFGIAGDYTGHQQTDEYGFIYTWNGSYWEANNPEEIKQIENNDLQVLTVDPTEIIESAVFKIISVEDDSGQASNFPAGSCEGILNPNDNYGIKNFNPDITKKLREAAIKLGYLK